MRKWYALRRMVSSRCIFQIQMIVVPSVSVIGGKQSGSIVLEICILILNFKFVIGPVMRDANSKAKQPSNK